MAFPPYRLDLKAEVLWRGDAQVRLRPKTFGVLRALACRPGELVTKEELLDTVWPDVSVSDVVLKVCVRELREALDDDPRRPRFIETAHRRGYRFMPQIEALVERPLGLSKVVGRDQELHRVAELLETNRLVSLTGPGGSGKTTLALLVLEAARLKNREAYWVDLSPLGDGALLPQAVASTLQVREHPERPLTDTICRRLAAGSPLLFLDNCEHLLPAAVEFLTEALQRCGQLRALTTSRERLGVGCEVIFPVPPLGLPDSDDLVSADRSQRSDAVRLFAERAREAEPSFLLTDANARLVGRICRRLDGMPLAIQLAASRVKLLSVKQISERLDNCFQVLAGGGANWHPRHQTLRATMEWSHQLLSGSERLLFARLSTLAGSWTLEDVEGICPDSSLPRHEILDLMERLVEKSLINVVEREPVARYRLLETVRQYAAEKLAESGSAAKFQRRHVDYFLVVGETIEPQINTHHRLLRLGELERESANLRAALRYSQDRGWWDQNLRLCGALWWFWFHRGWWSEGRRWISEALAAAADTASASRAKALFGSGVLAWACGALALARPALEESAKLWKELGNDRGLGDTLNFLGVEVLSEGEAGLARQYADESVRLLRGSEDSFSLPAALASLGIVALVQNDPKAEEFLAESVEIFHKLGDNWGEALPLRNLGILHMHAGNSEKAVHYLLESLRVLQPLGESWFASRSLESLAEALAFKGEHERAARFFGAAETLRESVGASILGFYRIDYDQALDRLRESLDAEILDELWREGRSWTREEALERALGAKKPVT